MREGRTGAGVGLPAGAVDAVAMAPLLSENRAAAQSHAGKCLNLRPVGGLPVVPGKVRLEERGSRRLGCRHFWALVERQGPARVKLSHPDLSIEQELSLRQDEKSLLNVLFSPG